MDSLGYSEHSGVINSIVAPTTAEIRLLENHDFVNYMHFK